MAVKKATKKVVTKKAVEKVAVKKATKKSAEKVTASKKTAMVFEPLMKRKNALISELTRILSILDETDLKKLEQIGKEAGHLSLEIFKNEDATEEDYFLAIGLKEIEDGTDVILNYTNS